MTVGHYLVCYNPNLHHFRPMPAPLTLFRQEVGLIVVVEYPSPDVLAAKQQMWKQFSVRLHTKHKK